MRRRDRNLCSQRVQVARLKMGITQEQLAARLTIAAAELDLLPGWTPSRQIVEKIEAGDREVTDKELVLLSYVLRVDPRLLLGYQERSTGEGNPQ